MSKVYILHGFIGSGKTTFAKQLEKETGAKRFTPDEIIASRYGNNLSMEKIRETNIKIKQEIWQEVEALINQNKDIILDYGLWKKEQRINIINKVKQLGAEPIFYEILCEQNIMRQRALERNSEGNNKITPEIYDEYLTRLEPMDEDEDRVTIYTN